MMSMKQMVQQRGSAKIGCLIAAGVALLLVLIMAMTMVGRYNGLVALQEKTEASWSEIDNQYKRRSDLIPQLIETVKGSKNYEEKVLTEVVKARAAATQPHLPSDPEGRAAYLGAQQQVTGALSRLLVTVEAYPDLKANAGFRDLQSQIEGTENRIAVARRDYIDRVKEYNTSLRKFPGNLVAGVFGFERVPQLQAATAEEREVPTIDFGDE